MALTLIWEDGGGVPDANSYARVEDCDYYFDNHVYPAPWSTSAADRKAEALILATRVIDAEFRFNGWRSTNAQGLQWPRINCPDPDQAPSTLLSPLFRTDNFLASNIVPRAVIDATCEMARELLITDRTAAPPGEGIQTATTGAGATFNSVTYSKKDTRPLLSEMTLALLSRFGSPFRGGDSAVRLIRS